MKHLNTFIQPEITPIDNRTGNRKLLVKRVREIKTLLPEYGFFTYLRIKDFHYFMSLLNNTN